MVFAICMGNWSSIVHGKAMGSGKKVAIVAESLPSWIIQTLHYYVSSSDNLLMKYIALKISWYFSDFLFVHASLRYHGTFPLYLSLQINHFH